jgi:hypothetical protein
MVRSRIMYIEDKSDQLVGPARIGRVTFSKTGKSLYYKGRTFQSLKGSGFKANYFDVDSGDHFWISGPKKNGADGLYGPRPTPIDADVREEYWTKIRNLPKDKNKKST